MNNEATISHAIETLQNAGFYTGTLWSIHDVKHKFECTNEQAMEVLDYALTNEWVIEQIQYAIREIGNDMGLTEIVDEETGEAL